MLLGCLKCLLYEEGCHALLWLLIILIVLQLFVDLFANQCQFVIDVKVTRTSFIA